ncbi:site-specific integrase [Nocardia sp. BMG51109]|uniref:tyrosine-type recombinase/integrase n=1 Tax=Nocardia sp. BMG51109 TaxID=1056816 RepID=UPI0004652F0B|nr:site-specific integrase [Nocardia sp. BMG51109]
MSSIRIRTRADGSSYSQVLYRHDGTQSSVSFDDHAAALRWRDILDRVGPAAALRILDAERSAGTTMVLLDKALTDYIDQLTGITTATRAQYHGYRRNDILPFMGTLPAVFIDRVTVARWVNGMEAAGASGKTIANKHGFLAAAMAWMVDEKIITANPCVGIRLPQHNSEMCFLELEEYTLVRDTMADRWYVQTEFAVASGARPNETAAVLVGDINRDQCTVRISKAWKRTRVNGWVVGPPKTKKSVRTINLPPETIELLDLDRPSDQLLFQTYDGGPVLADYYRKRAWNPAIAKLVQIDADGNVVVDKLNGKRPRSYDLRHTCASWMIAAGVPLPFIQAHLGHESIKTTVDRYGHLDRNAGAAAAEGLAAIRRRVPGTTAPVRSPRRSEQAERSLTPSADEVIAADTGTARTAFEQLRPLFSNGGDR